MKICQRSAYPSTADWQRLKHIADALTELSPASPPCDIVRVYNDYKNLFRHLMTQAPDVFPYLNGWTSLIHHKVNETRLQQDPDLLDKLVLVVEQSLQMIP